MRRYWVRVGSEAFEVEVEEAGDRLLVTVGGTSHQVELTEAVPSAFTIVVDGTPHDLVIRSREGLWGVNVDGAGYRVDVMRTRRVAGGGGPDAAAGSEEVRAPMPGLLIAILVREGDRVEMGQAVAIMEAMKMQMEIRAPHTGVIRRIHAGPGQELAAGQLLAAME